MKISSVARQINRVIKAGVNSPALKAFKKSMQLFKLDTGKNLLTKHGSISLSTYNKLSASEKQKAYNVIYRYTQSKSYSIKGAKEIIEEQKESFENAFGELSESKTFKNFVNSPEWEDFKSKFTNNYYMVIQDIKIMTEGQELSKKQVQKIVWEMKRALNGTKDYKNISTNDERAELLHERIDAIIKG